MNASFTSLFAAAERLASSADLDAAFSAATELMIRFPSEARAWSLRAYVRTRRGDYVAAVEDVTQAILVAPAEPKPFFDRGRYRLRLGKYAAAIEDFSQGLELCDRHSNNYYRETLLFMRAEALVQLGRLDEAMADLAHVREDFRFWTNRLVSRESLMAECRRIKLS